MLSPPATLIQPNQIPCHGGVDDGDGTSGAVAARVRGMGDEILREVT